MSIQELLPAVDESVKCADFTAELQVDPGGTAIRADVMVVAEAPLPWPKPVFDHPSLVGIPDIMAAARQPTRVLAAVPRHDDQLQVVVYRRSRRVGESPQRQVWATDEVGFGETVRAVVAGEAPPMAEAVDSATMGPELWICTQGSHDLCCGSYGTRLAEEVDDRFGDRFTVRRVSHTGGHRFAPTAVAMPSGRMWARLDLDDVETLLEPDTVPRPELIDRCRGWWGAAQGPEQVAERVGLSIFGWQWDLAMRDVAIVDQAERVTAVEVRALLVDGTPVRYRADVAVSREVPTIACRAVGGLPAKPGRELCIVGIEML